MHNQRLEISSRILSGFAANPAVFVARNDCGFACQRTDEEIARISLLLADKLIDAELITAPPVE